MPLHWHPSENRAATAACESVNCLSGSLHVYITQGISGGSDRVGSKLSVRFAPGQRVAWNPARDAEKILLTLNLVADHALWRNICSAVLDRDIFPRLASTPLWLRALFAALTVVPSWRNKLLSLMLWIQLQTIFLAHNFHMDHGYVQVTWPWIAQPFGGQPPVWAEKLEIASLYFIARVVMTAAYWTGTLLLGMKGEYAEYTPIRGHESEKR